ncbi:ATP synthase delta chain chloroplastic, partial [Bienertia sinuspersici]
QSHHHNLKLTSSFVHHHHPSSAAITTATSSISTLPQKDNYTPTLFSFYNPHQTITSPPRASVHCRAASGYAAALLDISQGNGTVLKVEKDVRRLSNLVFGNNDEQVMEFMRNEFVEEKVKGEVVKEFIEKGKFDGNLVILVKMVVNKGQSFELLKEVLQEFLRVFHQLTVAQPPHG